MRLLVTRDVEAPAQRVWDVVSDLEASPTVLSAIDRIERLDGGTTFGVGTRWRETRTMFGRQATEEMEVTALTAPRDYTVVSVSGSTTYTSTVAVEPLGEAACRLEMTFTGTSSSLVGRVLGATIGRALQGATRRALQRDLDDIADHAESSP